MNLEFELKVLLVSFTVCRHVVEIVIRVIKDFNLLEFTRNDTCVPHGSRGQEGECGIVDVKG